MDFAAVFGARLRRLIVDIDRKGLARKLGVSTSALNDYIAGRSLPRVDVAVRLARELGVKNLSWFLSDDTDALEPPRSDWAIVVEGAPHQTLIYELERQYAQLAKSVDSVLDKADKLPWEHVAIWLLSEPKSEGRTPLVTGCLETYKVLSKLSLTFCDIGHRLFNPSSLRRSAIQTADKHLPHEVHWRLESFHEAHPGVHGISHYLCNVDDEFMRQHSLTATADPATSSTWNGLRAWLLAQIVTHESVEADNRYDAIRKRLREMQYIDDNGKPRDFGDASVELGSFDIEPPQ